jgi:dolichol-phosphate mannosyltransferase
MKYSFVVPIYNDGALAEAFCREFQATFLKYLGVEKLDGVVEVIFVNDGSRDDSYRILRDEVCPNYSFVKVIDLARNFGQHIAVSAGYRFATGEYVGTSNVDMEDPPDQLVRMLEEIQKGELDFVGGRYRDRRVSWMNRVTSRMFARVLNRFTGYSVPLDMTTARVMNRRFVDAYNQLTEKSRYIPGLESWLGFRRGWVQIEHRPRLDRRSSYNFRRRLAMAVESIISFSDLPLKTAVMIGFLIAAGGFLMIMAMIIGKLFFVDFRAGYASTISIIVFMGGVQIMVIGLASLYIGRILREVQNRPLYVVRETYRL